MTSSLSDAWRDLADEARAGIAEWRQQHPTATLREIEEAIDERLAGLRARMVQDAALASAAADPAASGVRPRCPACGAAMSLEGARTRRLRTTYDREVTLTRRYARCPACGTGAFPLDEELALLPGALTPSLHEGVVRLGSWLPFARAAEMVAHFAHATVGEATARRLTEGAGAAYEAVQAADLARIERALPDDPGGPPVQEVSVDGVLVPVLKGAWVEAKVLAIGTVAGDTAAGEARATALSYFARHAEAAEFTRQALVETHRRGTATAGVVVGVADGAEWCQGFYDHHRPDAVRVLDFYHAQSYLVAAAQATFGAGTAAASEWLGEQCHALKHKTPEEVVAALATLPVATAPDRAAATAAQTEAVGYLGARLDQARYATFVAAGYPIGSGAVESANKLVVEARLKRAGMHWAPAHVNPMLALRTVACGDRWAEAWPRITAHVRQQARAAVATRRPDPPHPAVLALRDELATRPPRIVDGRPTDDHPWRAAARRRSPRPTALPKP